MTKKLTWLTWTAFALLARFVAGQSDTNNDRVFPKRTVEEAAVLEWGNSAIITALDASVAHFGPQTKDAALLEVETRPILAKPLNGVHEVDRKAFKENGTPLPVKPLENADEVVGSMVIMTNEGGLTGVQLAKVAQESGAAAVLVVNFDSARPDDIFRLPADEQGAKEIEIPVVMISLNSANLLASATYDNTSRRSPPSRLTNKYLPERVRLYAGDDRPFFEDVESSRPTVYLIHDLLTPAECDALIAQAEPRLEPFVKDDVLQHASSSASFHKVDRVTLWQGIVQFPAQKAIEERIEQVTAFPGNHFSDFIVDRYQAGSYTQPKYDIIGDRLVPVASITIFLSDAPSNGGGEIVYPSTSNSDSIKVLPRKGLAVVHHNTDERGQFDTSSQHAVLPPGDGPYYMAHKYIFMEPISYARRLALPALALPFGGKLPGAVVQLHEYMVGQFGPDAGESYFDKVCVFVPVLIVLLIAQMVADRVRGKAAKSTKADDKKQK
eukprot:scaffold2688_cov157-Amphora_coffeaeformis.AAC.7